MLDEDFLNGIPPVPGTYPRPIYSEGNKTDAFPEFQENNDYNEMLQLYRFSDDELSFEITPVPGQILQVNSIKLMNENLIM